MSTDVKQLPPYDPAVACPKCGQAGATTRYDDGRRWCPHDEWLWPDGGKVEHLMRTCTRCGFQWAERPAERAAADPPSPRPWTPPPMTYHAYLTVPGVGTFHVTCLACGGLDIDFQREPVPA